MDSSGVVFDSLRPLWPDLVDAGLESRGILLRSDEKGTRCLVALMTGRGFVILSPDAERVTASYIEPFEVYGVGPRAEEAELRFWATTDAEFEEGTVLLLFGGTTADKGRLLDRYSSTTGAYIDTDLLPFKTVEMAAGGGLVFAVAPGGTTIMALRPRL
jgi:hypothetical protein